MAIDDDDLLQPVLTRADNAVGFDRPWNPAWLTFATFFGGLAAGGWLLAENWRRLGHPERRWPLFAGMALAWLALTAATTWLHLRGWPGVYEAHSSVHARNARNVARLLTLGLALAVTARQQKRWKLWLAHGGEHAPLLQPAVGAIALAALAQFGVVTLLRAISDDHP
jgi:hypothetical protein